MSTGLSHAASSTPQFRSFLEMRREELHAAEALQNIAARFPELAYIWATSIIDQNRAEIAAAHERTTYQKIVDYFLSRQNDPVATPHISVATGIARGTVGEVLYRSQRDKFEVISYPNNPNRKMWRLRQPVYERHLATRLAEAERSGDDERLASR